MVDKKGQIRIQSILGWLKRANTVTTKIKKRKIPWNGRKRTEKKNF